MKRIFMILFALIGVFALAQAQPEPGPRKGPNPKMWKEIQEFKIKYLAQEMDLPADKMKHFSEIYNEMSDKRKTVFDEMRKTKRAIDKDKNATEADYEAATKKMEELRVRDMAIEKEYDAKFATFLSKKQIFKMKTAEESFGRKLAKIHHERKMGKKALKNKAARKAK